MDVRAAADKGAWMQLVHPFTNEEIGVEEKKPCRIKLLGADSGAYEEAVARTVSKRQAQLKGQRRSKHVTAEKILEESEKTSESQALELARVTVAWENIEWEGKELKLTQENAVMIYTAHKWIREQAQEFFADRTNYLGNVQ